MNHEELKAELKARYSLRIPGLKKSIGGGDAVRAVAEALGFEHCTKCDERKERLNRFLRFDAYLEEDRAE